jgi:hypothetical protein
LLHALAEAATLFVARRLRASLHSTAEAGEAPAGEPLREPLAEASAAMASPGTAMHALGKAGLLLGCGGGLIRRCHRVGPLLVSAADGSEGTVSIGRVRVPRRCATRIAERAEVGRRRPGYVRRRAIFHVGRRRISAPWCFLGPVAPKSTTVEPDVAFIRKRGGSPTAGVEAPRTRPERPALPWPGAHSFVQGPGRPLDAGPSVGTSRPQ